MVGQRYSGAPPSDPHDITTRLAMSNQISTATPNRISAATAAQTAASAKAAKTYVDTQDALYVSPSYYQGRDALNVANAAKGVPSGVATLDGGGHVPLAQFPAIGEGCLLGPFGPTATFSVSAGITPAKIADWHIGSQGLTFQPVVYAHIMAVCNDFGRPVIEIRISDGSAAYSFQTLVAQGVGRSNYNDEQAIEVYSASGVPGSTGTTTYPPTMNIWLSAWVYDPTDNGVTVTAPSIVSGSVFLMRMSQ